MHSSEHVSSPALEPSYVSFSAAPREWWRQLSAADRFGWLTGALLCAMYVVYFAQLRSIPLQDYPNHFARAVVLADLLFNDGTRFGEYFGVNLAPMPYVLHDLLFAALIQLFGEAVGTSVFTTLVLLSLPCALLFYMHVTGVAPRARLVVFVLSLFLTTDWFFLMAFMAFRLAVAWVLVSLAMAELLRRRWSLAVYGIYLAVLAAGYLTHLAATIFFLVVISVSAVCRLWARSSTPGRETRLGLPVLAVLAWHFGVVEEPRTDEYPAVFQFYWGRWDDKLYGLWHQFGRFGGRSSKLLVVLAVSCVGLASWRYIRPSQLKDPRVVENALIVLAFLGLYVLLPREYADSTYVDVRAQTMISLFILIVSLWLVHPGEGRSYDTTFVRALVVCLIALNFYHIVKRVTPVDHWLTDYRNVVAQVPTGARVLPISTRGRTGSFSPSLHAGSFLITDRSSIEPYLFSRNRGDIMKFFYYRNRPYMPQENWYREQLRWSQGTPGTFTVLGEQHTWRFRYSKRDRIWVPLGLVPIDWSRVACDYDLLLVTRPFHPRAIELSWRLVTQNEAAAVLAIDKSACRPEQEQPGRVVRLPSEH